jgi:hypothetical protein
MKTDISKNDGFRASKSVSPEEILAAGGTTAFGRRSGKSNETLIKRLESLPKPEPFTEEEWADALADLKNNK